MIMTRSQRPVQVFAASPGTCLDTYVILCSEMQLCSMRFSMLDFRVCHTIGAVEYSLLLTLHLAS